MKSQQSLIENELDYSTTTKKFEDFIIWYESGVLNLQPGFQRQSVWSQKDREQLIDSITRRYPIPAIFLYRRIDLNTKKNGL